MKTEQTESAARQAEVQNLIDSQRTMVLATTDSGLPWVAPVYYVYQHSGFYFFSSPRSRHIIHALAGGSSAAAIFADGEKWQDLHGLQMTGKVQPVNQKITQIKIKARFILKFPFARPFLQTGLVNAADVPQVAQRVGLYTFLPQAAYYVNNRLGFGQRLPIDLD